MSADDVSVQFIKSIVFLWTDFDHVGLCLLASVGCCECPLETPMFETGSIRCCDCFLSVGLVMERPRFSALETLHMGPLRGSMEPPKSHALNMFETLLKPSNFIFLIYWNGHLCFHWNLRSTWQEAVDQIDDLDSKSSEEEEEEEVAQEHVQADVSWHRWEKWWKN